MSLYVRVFNNFWSHRKTMRLRLAIGTDAFWVPQRIWSYASENAPDGCFKDYTPAELAMLIGYPGNAQALLDALLQAGFMDADPLRIHDWGDHNGYHQSFSDRAKSAAKARWGKDRKGHRKERKRKETSTASRMPVASSPPSLESIVLYCSEHGIPKTDAEWFFHKCVGNGWTNDGKPILSWAGTIASWKVAGYLPSQKNGKPQQSLPGGFD